MGLPIDYLKRVGKLLDLSQDEVKELIFRMEGHYKQHGADHFEVARSFFILKDIWMRKAAEKLEKEIPTLGFKHMGLLKYRCEIVQMMTEGLGSQKIHEALKYKNGAPSLATIKRYMKAYKEWRV
jgi:hypothetical protein